jgi:undecaprenyl pyrophosphate phosphatase UppP
VEGVTEYLPISSTGHLLITSRLLGLPDEQGSAGLEAVNTYAIAIQFGAIVAVAGLATSANRSSPWGRANAVSTDAMEKGRSTADLSTGVIAQCACRARSVMVLDAHGAGGVRTSDVAADSVARAAIRRTVGSLHGVQGR